MRNKLLTLSACLAMCFVLAGVGLAQDTQVINGRAMLDVVPQHPAPFVSVPGKQLVQWNGSFIDHNGAKQTFTMAGTNPSKTNVTTTFSVWIIPVKFVYDASHGNMTFDPLHHKLSNGRTVIQNTLKSPLFNAGIDFKQGKTDLGNTQYVDAFQRGTWWGKNVKVNTKYHVLFKTLMKPEQTINCTDSSCSVQQIQFQQGGPTITAGLADINYYDAIVRGFMSKLGATPDILPLFIWYDIYLTEGGGCCVGGYHFETGGQPGGQTYSNSAYADVVKIFSQDVSAMSHELGEWMDDPFGDNAVNCPQDQNVLEVGDPLETEINKRAQFGAYAFKLNGFTYHLQSLVFMPYFGAPKSTSANGWFAFQNDIGACPGQ